MFRLAGGDGGVTRPVLRAASFAGAVLAILDEERPRSAGAGHVPPASLLAAAPFIPKSREAVAEFGSIRNSSTPRRACQPGRSGLAIAAERLQRSSAGYAPPASFLAVVCVPFASLGCSSPLPRTARQRPRRAKRPRFSPADPLGAGESYRISQPPVPSQGRFPEVVQLGRRVAARWPTSRPSAAARTGPTAHRPPRPCSGPRAPAPPR